MSALPTRIFLGLESRGNVYNMPTWYLCRHERKPNMRKMPEQHHAIVPLKNTSQAEQDGSIMLHASGVFGNATRKK